ncbi:MAG: hypothetical protein HS124_01290 [Anaerolineales bacterium]|nr:hypothetical protein [Anaerolineales bacterium]MCL4259890.1 hypothetical protein [Anaerolineales bacterium]
MAQKRWHVVEVCYCEHAGREARLEAQVIDPAESVADQPSRIVARRCSNAIECNVNEKIACAYCGTNPNHVPI